MDEKEVLNKTVDTLVQKPLRIEIDIIDAGWFEKLLIKLKFRNSKKTFEIKPLVYAKGMRITQELFRVQRGSIEKNGIIRESFKLFAENGDLVAKCLAIAVGDARLGPDPALTRFFLNNMTPADGALIISKLLDKVDVTSFMSTIISATGMSLLKPGGTIAPGPSSED